MHSGTTFFILSSLDYFLNRVKKCSWSQLVSSSGTTTCGRDGWRALTCRLTKILPSYAFIFSNPKDHINSHSSSDDLASGDSPVKVTHLSRERNLV